MCGINGFVGRPPKGKEPQFRAFMDALMVETMSRGPHATGCAAWIGGSRSVIGKGPVDATNFIKVPIWDRALEGKAMIGHCRYATHGSPSKNENNHPFEQGRWALVHNGVVSSYRQIAQSEHVTLSTECDSEIILRVFAKHAGKDGDVRKGLQGWVDAVGHASADYAVAILDRTNGAIHLLRDDGRPCAILRLPHLGIVAFASTKEILSRAFDKMFDQFKDDIELYEDAETWDCVRDRIYTLRPGDLNVQTTDIKVPEQTFEQKVYGFSRGGRMPSTGVWQGTGGVMEVCPRCGQATCGCGRDIQYSNEM